MPLAVTDEDGVNVSSGVYTPNPAGISASGFAKIKRLGAGAEKIVLEGDDVASHANNVPIIHSSDAMVSTMQSFFTVNSINVILIGDASSCDPTHKVTATAQTFVNVTPK